MSTHTLKDGLRVYKSVSSYCLWCYDIDTGLWIKDYFLKSPDVVISNSGHFHEILTSYLKDPC